MDDSMYEPQQQMDQQDYAPQMYQTAPSQFQYPDIPKKRDLFAELDKTAYIIIFIAFILGFFMGKTMQPVILRPN